MKFFIDTANLDQIKEAHALGILDGVTTNPSLMAKEGKELAGLHPNIVLKVPMIKEKHQQHIAWQLQQIE